MESIWNKDIKRQEFERLNGDIKTDVLIIGGGLSGIFTAYTLKNAGIDCVLVEAYKILSGVTSGTTAKITYQHGLIYDKIIKKYGEEKAYLYYKSQKSALDKITSLAKDLDVDFEYATSFVYSMDNSEKIENEVRALEKIGCDAEFTKKTELPFSVAGAVKIENQGKFHPLKFAYTLSKDLKVYENTKVLELKPGQAVTNRGRIEAKNIIVATHFPFINKHGGYFIKLYQHRTYALALENAGKIKGMYVDESKDGLSFRSHKDLLLLLGGSHKTGKHGGNFRELDRVKEKYYPEAKEVTRWATQDCMTLDSIPYIGIYSKGTKALYVATGFNKWGVTSSMVSAIMLSDMIKGIKSDFEELYSPARNMFHPQLAVNILESAKGLLTPTVPRCPHLGCALKYNREERTWDCPCHGSRFTEDGKLLDNPATSDKK